MSAPGLHPALAPIRGLLGRWQGKGQGVYPTIDSFEYEEEVRFWHTGRPWLGYEQRTKRPGDGTPMHSELGYWRVLGKGRIEIVLAHAFGIAEVQEGNVAGKKIEVTSKTLASTSTANKVEAVTRVYELEGDRLTYTVGMAFGDQPLQNHLSATLARVGD